MTDLPKPPGPRMLRVGAIYLLVFGGTYLALAQMTGEPTDSAADNVSLVLSNVLPMAIFMSATLFTIGLVLTLRGRSSTLAAPEASDV